MSRIYFDIETTGFSADNDRILTAAFLDDDNDALNFTANPNIPDDSEIAGVIRDILINYDEVVGWNSNAFDLKFIIKALARGGEYPFLVHSIDAMDRFSQKFPYMPKSLDIVAKTLMTPHQKTPLDMAINYRCRDDVSDDYAWQSLREHNIEDVYVTRDICEALGI